MSFGVKIGAVIIVLAVFGAATGKPVKYYTMDARYDSGMTIRVAGPMTSAACVDALTTALENTPANAIYMLACTPHR